ncbi:glycosyltransferase [Limosilactobacillus fermentum]|uniref:glycosyltransferase n=2 Tax=Limosilactobacillus TaxID=2742598 RepID=UPI003FA554EC
MSVIVPTFNSSNYIIDLLHSINENFQKSKIEVVVVDDGSTDNTLNLVSDFSFNGNISR